MEYIKGTRKIPSEINLLHMYFNGEYIQMALNFHNVVLIPS